MKQPPQREYPIGSVWSAWNSPMSGGAVVFLVLNPENVYLHHHKWTKGKDIATVVVYTEDTIFPVGSINHWYFNDINLTEWVNISMP